MELEFIYMTVRRLSPITLWSTIVDEKGSTQALEFVVTLSLFSLGWNAMTHGVMTGAIILSSGNATARAGTTFLPILSSAVKINLILA